MAVADGGKEAAKAELDKVVEGGREIEGDPVSVV